MPNKRSPLALILEALAKERMQDVLRFCEDGTVSPRRLEELLPDMGRSQLRRRLSLGEEVGILRHARFGGMPPRAGFEVATSWPHVKDAYAAALAWEEASYVAKEPRAGLFAMQTAANPRWVPIVAALADQPLEFHELAERIGGPQTTLWEQMQRLVADQLLEIVEAPCGVLRYVAGESVRRLTILPVICVSMEWSLGRVVDPVYASNLHDLVHAIAPLAQASPEVSGDCQLHVDCRACLQPDVYIRIEAGRLLPLTRAPDRAPKAVAHATPAGWCHALLRGCPAAADHDGSSSLYAAALTALSGALVPDQLAIRLRLA